MTLFFILFFFNDLECVHTSWFRIVLSINRKVSISLGVRCHLGRFENASKYSKRNLPVEFYEHLFNSLFAILITAFKGAIVNFDFQLILNIFRTEHFQLLLKKK